MALQVKGEIKVEEVHSTGDDEDYVYSTSVEGTGAAQVGGWEHAVHGCACACVCVGGGGQGRPGYGHAGGSAITTGQMPRCMRSTAPQ